jgi:hypothetical protein
MQKTMTQEEIDAEYARQKAFFDPKLLAKGKKPQSPSNKLTSDIIEYIRLLGGYARRVNVQGTYDAAKGAYRKSGMKKGFEDIDVIMPININGIKVGLKCAIEVKIGRDKQSPEQIARQQEINSCGGIYLVAKDMTSFNKDFTAALARYM